MKTGPRKTEEIFRKIQKSEERILLIDDLIKARAVIMCKGDSDNVIKLVPEELVGSNQISCSLQDSSEKPTHDKEKIICNVYIGAEKYFFQTELFLEGSKWRISIPTDVYHLQRRQDFRIKIPANYHGFLSIQSIDGEKFVSKSPLKDISMGGCGILITPGKTKTLNTNLIQVHREILGILEVVRRPSIEIKGEIRYVRFDIESYTCGIEFKERGHELDRGLFALTMDLHREFFTNSAA